MYQVLCSQLVGRRNEMSALAEDLAAVRSGQGRATLVMGEAGVGKSRLLHEIETRARRENMRVLVGRAVEGPAGAYRPIIEALLSGIREAGLPDALELAPFRPILGRLLPEWRQAEQPIATHGVDGSAILLGEAILRLLRVLGHEEERPGSVFILEDLHWADVDTLAVVEYLIDNLRAEPILLLAALRSDEPSPALAQARRIAGRRAARILELSRLGPDNVKEMARLCLTPGGQDREPPAPMSDALFQYTEGLPFLVEELLAAWMNVGALVRGPHGWSVGNDLSPIAPLTFAESINRRLAALGDETQRVLETAAMLGRRFDSQDLAAAIGVESGRVHDCLRTAVDAQLVTAAKPLGGYSSTAFEFRHALTREAILARLLPVQRAALAAQVLAVVERVHPGLSGTWCELAAGLALESGERERAARLLLQSGVEAADRGALATAEGTLDRALTLATDDQALQREITTVLMRTLALAGKWERVFELGESLLQSLAPEGADSLAATIHIQMARAAVSAGQWEETERSVEAAYRKSGRDDALLAQVDALRALLAIERLQLEEARTFANRALERAERTVQPDVACEALEVLGRCARVTDIAGAADAFERARIIAEENGLSVRRIRAVHELGTLDIFGHGRMDRLLEARTLAVQSGALATAAVVDIQICACLDNLSEFEQEIDVARRAREMAHRLHLDVTEAAAFLFEGTAFGHLGRRQEMEAALREALRLAGHEPDIVAGAWESRTFASLVEEHRAQALVEVEMAMAAVRGLPATTPGPYRGLWPLLLAVEGKDCSDACADLRKSGATVLPINRTYLAYAEAIAAARAGRRQDAVAAVSRADEDLIGRDWFRSVGLRLVGEVALHEGWGDARWIEDAHRYFAAHGYERPATACAALLRRAGHRAPTSNLYRDVPEPLRSLGVTRREMDVLTALSEGLSNREIGARLYLSPRTVEKHVASLLAKTATRARAQLAALAATTSTPSA